MNLEDGRDNDEKEAESSPQKGVRREGESLSKHSAPFLYPSWKRTSSDSEFSDSEVNAQSKLRYEETLCLVSVHVAAIYIHTDNRKIIAKTHISV